MFNHLDPFLTFSQLLPLFVAREVSQISILSVQFSHFLYFSPGGGNVRIESVKLDFKDKAQAKVGSLDNAHHIPGGGHFMVSVSSILPIHDLKENKFLRDCLNSQFRYQETLNLFFLSVKTFKLPLFVHLL